MNSNYRLLSVMAMILLAFTLGCKSTDKANNQSAADADTEVKKLSPADLAQLRDNHKLAPDAAIVSGETVRVLTNDNNDFVLRVEKLEKNSFGFSNQLTRGDELSVIGGRKAKDLKKGQSVLIVISVRRRPGVEDQYFLEKVLAAMPGD